jgi:PAS domain S-box-containing protein
MSERATLSFDRARCADEPDFRQLAEVAPILIRRTGADRRDDWFNRTWLDFTGRPMAGEVGAGWIDNIHPDDTDRHATVFARAFDAREPYALDYRLRRHDGSYRWIAVKGEPFTRHGVFAGYWSSGTDITEHRDAQQSQRVLINDLNHRMKNTLTVVQAMAEQTFREGRSMAEAIACFGGRLRALASMQDQLVANAWETVPLRDLIVRTCAPLDPGGGRIRLEGPGLVVCAEKAVALTMALHELSTNAVKYGALSNDTGRVAITWRTCVETGGQRLRLVWKERGGPAVSVPVGRGFGSRFIERCLGGGEAGDRSTLCFEADGVRWALDTALSA